MGQLTALLVLTLSVGVCVTYAASETELGNCDMLVGAFNIQVLGQSKMSKKSVVDHLVTIIKRYDCLLIQEVRDSSGEAIPTLANLVSGGGTPFEYVLSDRLGRTNSKEQYAVFYRSDKLTVSSWSVYSDPGDKFEREPIIAHISAVGQYANCFTEKFAVIGAHIRPSDVPAELDALVDVYDSMLTTTDNPNALLMGDFNADCSYLSNTAERNARLFNDPRFTNLLESGVDTTVKDSYCAYDRIIAAGDSLKAIVVEGSATVYRYDEILQLSQDEADDVSDHYPVDVILKGADSTAVPARGATSNVKRRRKQKPVSPPCALCVGAFNADTFGRMKASKDAVVDSLVEVIRRYDVVLVQEIRDASGKSIVQLADAVKSKMYPIDYVLSERLGDSSNKEQYAVFYRTDELEVIKWFVADDPTDVFERPPIVVQFKGSGAYKDCFNLQFSLVGIHVKPSDAVSELAGLSAVYDHVAASLGNANALILGDMSADCSYLSNTEEGQVALFTEPRYDLLISDYCDTTLSSSNCAYDRIVAAGDELKAAVVPGTAGVYRFDKDLGLDADAAEDVSNHYPVEVELATSKRLPNQ